MQGKIVSEECCGYEKNQKTVYNQAKDADI